MDRYDPARRRRPQASRSALGYWVPLVLTVTLATAGLAAWVWSERQQNDTTDDDNDHDNDNDNDQRRQSYSPPRDSPEPDSFYASPPPYPPSESSHQGFLARVSRRTPSPQQFFDSAGHRLAAGVAAAGAAVGLSAVREDERDVAFSDHEGWNEEAESKRSRLARQPPKSRRTVAVVLSAHSSSGQQQQGGDVGYRSEHASILSHLPQRFDPATTRLFVLIYTPEMTRIPSAYPSGMAASSNLSSSYSAISMPGRTPSESDSPVLVPSSPSAPPNPYFDALWTQSLALVDRPSMILPFSTPTGYIHILRHLAPSIVYLADAPDLSGPKGGNVAQLKGWVGQTILVVGDDGHGGLADTETETEDESHGPRGNRWWETSNMIGLGKDVEVVDADRVGDDWQRRLSE